MAPAALGSQRFHPHHHHPVRQPERFIKPIKVRAKAAVADLQLYLQYRALQSPPMHTSLLPLRAMLQKGVRAEMKEEGKETHQNSPLWAVL